MLYGGSLLRYGVREYFSAQGIQVDLGQVSLRSFHEVELAYVRFSKQASQEHKFELELNKVRVQADLFKLALRGHVNRITFREPRIYWGHLNCTLFNPLEQTCFDQHGQPLRPQGISFTDTIGVLSLKALTKQRIQFDLFPDNYDTPFGVISGTFYEDEQSVRGQIDIQSADLGLSEGLIRANLAEDGAFTGLLELEWNPEYVALNIPSYRLSQKDVFSTGTMSFLNYAQTQEDDIFKAQGQIGFRGGHVDYVWKHTYQAIDADVSLTGSNQQAVHRVKLSLKKDKQKTRVLLNYSQKHDFVLDGYIDENSLHGHLNWTLKDKKQYRAPIVIHPDQNLYLLQLDHVESKEELFPGFQMTFDVNQNRFVIPEVKWGDSLVTGQSEVSFRPQLTVQTDLDLKAFDTALLEPFFSSRLGEVFRGIVSGSIEVQGELLEPQYQVDLELKDGYLKNLRYVAGEFHAQGQGRSMLINESRFQRKSDTIFFEGELAYRKGRFDNTISYRTDGQALELSGWTLQKRPEQKSIIVEKKINDQLSFRLKNQAGYIADERLGTTDTSVELEYDLLSSDDKIFFSMQNDSEVMGVKRKYEF